MENIRVITHKNNIGQIIPGDEDDSFTFELCLEDNGHMPFWKDYIKDIEMANDKEAFTYAFNLGQNMKI